MTIFKITDQQKKEFGRVAVFCGGTSAERAVSLDSGKAVTDALCSAGVDAFLVDTQSGMHDVMARHSFDRVFLALHGRGGEDGTIQGYLTCLGIPFTGSGVLSSALAMDKYKTKLVWQSLGLPTPESFILESDLNEEQVRRAERMGYPLCVKPVSEGSSIGVFKVQNLDELTEACASANQHQAPVLVEKWVEGKEFTIGILDRRQLPVIGLFTNHVFYDYDAKYIANDTGYLLPSGLSDEEEAAMQQLAMQAYDAVGCNGWGRVDVMKDAAGKVWLLEVNTTPGMTSHSLVPMAAKHVGISFPELVVDILRSSLSGVNVP